MVNVWVKMEFLPSMNPITCQTFPNAMRTARIAAMKPITEIPSAVHRSLPVIYPREILDHDEAAEALFVLAESAGSEYAPPYAIVDPGAVEHGFAHLLVLQTSISKTPGRPAMAEVNMVPTEISRGRAMLAERLVSYHLYAKSSLALVGAKARDFQRRRGRIFVTSLEAMIAIACLPPHGVTPGFGPREL